VILLFVVGNGVLYSSKGYFHAADNIKYFYLFMRFHVETELIKERLYFFVHIL